jgi:glycosyltransferase involved in cell wall biosynthesis
MKVLLCKGQFMGPISGADETLVTYATSLLSEGHSPSVLLMYPHERRDPYAVRLRRAGVPISSIASRSMRLFLKIGRTSTKALLSCFSFSHSLIRNNAHKVTAGISDGYLQPCRDYFEQSGADVVHVMTPDPSAAIMINAAHAAGLPVLYQELGIPYHPPGYESHYDHFTSALPLCSEVAALSPRLVQMCLSTSAFPHSVSVVPIMSADLSNGNSYRRSTSPRVTTFGFTGRIELLKGPHYLIEAFAIANQRTSNMRLRIAGCGSQKRVLATRANALKLGQSLKFVGAYRSPEQRSTFMQGLDVLVLPSLTEGTPNSIVEAMAHGLPIVASAVGGIPDMVTEEIGILVPPGDTLALAEALVRLAGDPALRARMGRASRAKYEECWSPQAVMPVLLKTYERMLLGNYASSSEGS